MRRLAPILLALVASVGCRRSATPDDDGTTTEMDSSEAVGATTEPSDSGTNTDSDSAAVTTATTESTEWGDSDSDSAGPTTEGDCTANTECGPEEVCTTTGCRDAWDLVSYEITVIIDNPAQNCSLFDYAFTYTELLDVAGKFESEWRPCGGAFPNDSFEVRFGVEDEMGVGCGSFVFETRDGEGGLSSHGYDWPENVSLLCYLPPRSWLHDGTADVDLPWGWAATFQFAPVD